MNKMMDNDFDFEKIGKITPYRTPEHFFEDNQKKIIKKTVGDKHKPFKMRTVILTIIATAAIMTGIITLPSWHKRIPETNQSTSVNVTADIDRTNSSEKQLVMTKTERNTTFTKNSHIAKSVEKKCNNTFGDETGDNWIEQLSDEDLISLNALADNDEFLN
jgi:hypothetical protein